ncbi:MAG TPA: anti-sigma factor [Steroidobacteraceae bacterium]|jgi:anti-sigma factor RsiW|nr:anti-sigma factor [Steroidobacteraceae bacterium]
MQCAESSRAQAYFDGEVDAVTAADVERHVAQCPQCSALLEELAQMRARMQRELEYGQAPPRLRLAIERMLDEESAGGTTAAAAARPRTVARRPTSPAWRTRTFWLGASGGLGAALAASVVLFVLSATPTDPLLDDVISAHVRSLMPEHLTDVVSTDRHTVKPWFAGHVDVSPVVADFAAQGYRLVGGRADYFDHQRAAVVVYQHGAHVINVFTWVAGRQTFPERTTRSGYHVAFWRVGNLQYCAVSDAGWEELSALVRLLRDAGAGDPH